MAANGVGVVQTRIRRPGGVACHTWRDPTGCSRVRVRVTRDEAVVLLSGPLGKAAVQPMAAAVETALAFEPSRLALDLAHACPVPAGPDGPDLIVAVLAAITRLAAWRGVQTRLVHTPGWLSDRLVEAGLGEVFGIGGRRGDAS
jgi:hypothetical protein